MAKITSPGTSQRRFLMCPPTYFKVRYQLNPWMDPGTRVDTALAVQQWESLRTTYLTLGHQVDLIDPLPDLPDMVYAANGGVTYRGRALGPRFRHPERAAEAPAYENWLRSHGFRVIRPVAHNEGEGDLLLAGEVMLGGYGFRTDRSAHAEARWRLGREVISLRLIDPRFYHLDTALTVLDAQTVAYYPPAFSPGSCDTIERTFPNLIIASDEDADVLGTNAISDGVNVVLAAQATRLADQIADRGFQPVPVDLSELLKGGGGIKCCTLTLRE